ncbi:dihydrofolate reductase family protein [Agromyces aerolatus]|uniref:dihydrofolate reductase family protein n=1 Tax=Agromyces sp. LY-1074 TaxID=3074080 RepID=UPI00285C7EBF|nr:MULTISPECIES: dihydrofolate reductase family protein [unclassified Agromyces]MDR5701850.1 dihydrofolate reductase family protein [Agromyces sp. LY-1074]MDR5708077.1 dihydrofolate reductase family protein [Agromyces sp. LY-1358]
MSELMIDFITSLDGYAAADGWPGLWGLEGPEYLAFLEDPAEQDHTTLMGATTYRLMSAMAQAGGDPTVPEASGDEAGFDALARMPKVVFSATLEEPLAWPNTRLVRDDAVETVRRMKADGIRMRTLGSLSLARTLLTAGLVDRFRVGVFPVINGRTGRERIYDAYPDVALDLVESRVFDGRILLLEYVPTVLERAPLESV